MLVEGVGHLVEVSRQLSFALTLPLLVYNTLNPTPLRVNPYPLPVVYNIRNPTPLL